MTKIIVAVAVLAAHRSTTRRLRIVKLESARVSTNTFQVDDFPDHLAVNSLIILIIHRILCGWTL